MFKNNLSVFKEYLLLPDGRELLGLLVVTSKTVDSALDKNQPELGVLVFPVPLKMLADSNCFLDQVIQILWDLRSKTFKKIKRQTLSYLECYVIQITDSGEIEKYHELSRFSRSCFRLHSSLVGYRESHEE